MRIKEIMKQKGYTQKMLAQKIGITEVGMMKILKNDNPRMDTMRKLADALGVEIWEFFKQKEEIYENVKFCAMVYENGDTKSFMTKRELVEWLLK